MPQKTYLKSPFSIHIDFEVKDFFHDSSFSSKKKYFSNWYLSYLMIQKDKMTLFQIMPKNSYIEATINLVRSKVEKVEFFPNFFFWNESSVWPVRLTADLHIKSKVCSAHRSWVILLTRICGQTDMVKYLFFLQMSKNNKVRVLTTICEVTFSFIFPYYHDTVRGVVCQIFTSHTACEIYGIFIF